jgi:hypothetical protein
MELLRPDRCSVCKWDLPVGRVAMWDAQRCDVVCLDCAATPPWELAVAPQAAGRRSSVTTVGLTSSAPPPGPATAA